MLRQRNAQNRSLRKKMQLNENRSQLALCELRWLAPLLYCYSEPSRNLPVGRVVLGGFLVYVAAVLLYKPIFTQPLGFVPCTAGAVEKFATDGAVSVRSTGSEVVLPQKRRSIFCPITSRCGCIRPAFSAGWGRPVRGNAVSFRLRPDQGKGWRGIQPVCAAAWRGTGR